MGWTGQQRRPRPDLIDYTKHSVSCVSGDLLFRVGLSSAGVHSQINSQCSQRMDFSPPWPAQVTSSQNVRMFCGGFIGDT